MPISPFPSPDSGKLNVLTLVRLLMTDGRTSECCLHSQSTEKAEGDLTLLCSIQSIPPYSPLHLVASNKIMQKTQILILMFQNLK